jgi:hypothetical protein
VVNNTLAYSAKGDSSLARPFAIKNILHGGLAVGVLDGLAAVISSALRGVSPTRVFQFVASGLLGRSSFQGGTKTALLGVLLHFVIAFSVATIYYFASRKLPILIRRAILCGMIYGVMVYFAMQYLVLPFSAVTKGPFSLTGMLQGLIIHMFFVGLPAALVARRSAKENSI